MSLLRVRGLGKAYRSYKSEWMRFGRWFGLPIRPTDEHWVLKNVSFTIEPGEALGIIGQNGAGKSTLLKLITGTLQPSEGSLEINGRISAILELGLGFNPELTGRQNTFHAAGLMGATIHQIEGVIHEIEAFAEIGEYFDLPVRTYSSGMQARLAFSVATAFRPEILIVDEALAVGDAYFIHKCNDRIRKFQKSGTSLLVVAHDREAIRSLCNRAILLEKGEVIRAGRPEEVMDFYNALIAERENSTVSQRILEDGRVQTSSGTGEAKVIHVELVNESEHPVETVEVGELIKLVVDIQVQEDLGELVFGYLFKDRLGQDVYGTNTHHLKIPLVNLKKGENLRLEFIFLANLGPGSYSISTALHTGALHVTHNYEWRDLTTVFTVFNAEKPSFVGVNWMQPISVHQRQLDPLCNE